MEGIFNISEKNGVLKFFAEPRRPPSRCPRSMSVRAKHNVLQVVRSVLIKKKSIK